MDIVKKKLGKLEEYISRLYQFFKEIWIKGSLAKSSFFIQSSIIHFHHESILHEWNSTIRQLSWDSRNDVISRDMTVCMISFFLSFKRALAENCSPRNESVELLHKLKKKKKKKKSIDLSIVVAYICFFNSQARVFNSFIHYVNVLCSPSCIKLVLFFAFNILILFTFQIIK